MQTTSLKVIYNQGSLHGNVPLFESLACSEVGAVIFESFFSSRELEEMIEKIYSLPEFPPRTV